MLCLLMVMCASIAVVPAYAAEAITVAVASSLYPAMQQHAELFEQNQGVKVRLVSGSTGRLYNQIMQGAPFDVFISADRERPALLASRGKAIAQYDVGRGYLGLMAAQQRLIALRELKSPLVRHIAIANPDVAPFGRVTRELLQRQGLWDVLKHKFVYTRNAMQAAMMVNDGLVDAGFVPLASNAFAMAMIRYQGVLLSDKAAARLWLETIATSQQSPAHRAVAALQHP